MNKRRKYHFISIFCFLIAGVLIYLLSTTLAFNPGRIYTNNELIAREEDSYHNFDGTGTIVDENGALDFSLKNFSGARTVHTLDIIEETEFLSFSWDILIYKGDFKIVLVSTSNRTVEILCEGSGQGQKNLFLPPGDYRIKFVGKSAVVKGQLEINILEKDIEL